MQGRAKEIDKVKNYLFNKQVLFLTWDEPQHDSIYFPESTWAEGRKKLLSIIKIDKYDYVIFVDADFDILRGNISSFEKKLAQYRPAIAVPVVDKNKNQYKRYLKKFKQALVFHTDEQFQAIEVNVLNNLFNNNPYVSRYDQLSWWYPCVIVQAFISRLLWRSSLVDLEFEITNGHEGGYINRYSPEYIHNEIKKYGIKWYFPFLANDKKKLRSRISNQLYYYLDKIILNVSIYLFKFIFKKVDQALIKKLYNDKRKVIFK